MDELYARLEQTEQLLAQQGMTIRELGSALAVLLGEFSDRTHDQFGAQAIEAARAALDRL